ncbi:hypothetical protein BaRGS_00017828 [Batillaria attramentaria]|uniref:Uncharacterized protein n=1 Tax=Batillaria attramentaria TaxID=370345 RepID=A0ABD0KVC3_9CAEN
MADATTSSSSDLNLMPNADDITTARPDKVHAACSLSLSIPYPALHYADKDGSALLVCWTKVSPRLQNDSVLLKQLKRKGRQSPNTGAKGKQFPPAMVVPVEALDSVEC